MEKIHYVYKIINIKNQKEYIGVRSSPSPEDDNYMGSSKILENLYRIEGKENFNKIILKKFNTRKEAELYESSLLTEAYCNSPNTYNIQNTGEFKGKKHGFRKDLWYDYYNEIREKYENGITSQEISKIYNCDSGTIRSIIHDIKRSMSEIQKIRFTKHPVPARNKEIDKEINNIIKLYVNDKKSILFISQFYNVNISVIKKRLVENNIEIRTHKQSQGVRTKRRRKEIWNQQKEIVHLYNMGTLVSHIAKEYQVDHGTIKNILKENKVWEK